VAIEVAAALPIVTPVDTGWAASNWIPNIGGPAVGTDLDSRDEARTQGASTARQEAGRLSLLTYKLNQGPIHITNNVPYIGTLNRGSSQQAPPAFVQLAITGAIRRVSRFL
jgi:hypothetical protein